MFKPKRKWKRVTQGKIRASWAAAKCFFEIPFIRTEKSLETDMDRGVRGWAQASWGQNAHRGPRESRQSVSAPQRGLRGAPHPESCPGRGSWRGPQVLRPPVDRPPPPVPSGLSPGRDAPVSLQPPSLCPLPSPSLPTGTAPWFHGAPTSRGSLVGTGPSSPHACSGLRGRPRPARFRLLFFCVRPRSCNVYRAWDVFDLRDA